MSVRFQADTYLRGDRLWITEFGAGDPATTAALYAVAGTIDLKELVGWGFLGLAVFLLGLILVVVGVMLQFWKGEGWIALWVVGLILVALGLGAMVWKSWRPVLSSPEPKFVAV